MVRGNVTYRLAQATTNIRASVALWGTDLARRVPQGGTVISPSLVKRPEDWPLHSSSQSAGTVRSNTAVACLSLQLNIATHSPLCEVALQLVGD